MRLLYVVTAAEFGGPSRHVLALMEHMVGQGHEVGLVSAPEPRLSREAGKLGATLFPNPYFVRRLHPYRDILAVYPLFKAMRTFKPDLVSCHSTKASFAGRFVCQILRPKAVVHTAHSWSFREGISPWSQRFYALAERIAATGTSKIICVSNHDRELALRFKVGRPDRRVVIHNGIDEEPFLRADPSIVKKEFGLGSVPVVTMVARFALPAKDHLTLLEACSRVSDRFKLLLVGAGESRTQMETFAQQSPSLRDRVIFLGEREDIPEILAASDIFVLASRFEGLPRAIIEAMLSGLPVVASRVGGVPELVDDGVTGFLVPPKDPGALGEALSTLLGNEDLRRRQGEAGRMKAQNHFTLQSMLQSTQAVYEELIHASPVDHLATARK